MFSVGKTLLFIVTIITSAAFLFFIPHFHLSIEFGSLITIHRIKSFLTLLSPIIFGAITAYIAYQQHCLAKTQANISRDQRDIAHNKLRIENNEKFYMIYDHILNSYNSLFNLPYFYPKEFYKDNKFIQTKKIHDIITSQCPNYIKEWFESYMEKENKTKENIEKLWFDMKRCHFIFDNNLCDCIEGYFYETGLLLDMKKKCLIKHIDGHNITENINEIIAISENTHRIIDIIRVEMEKYIDISDILAPRKFN